MPAYYDLPATFGNASVEDVDKFNSLPYYLVMNEIQLFPRWNIWDRLFGTIDWETNMGDIMRAVTPQPSPVGETFFFPQNVTADPHKNIYETGESTEEARVKWHRYESKQFSFLPYFRAFWRNQIKYTHKDIVRQVQVSNNMFVRTNVWFKSPQVYVAGKGLLDAPVADGNAALTAADSKNLNWLTDRLPEAVTNLSLRVMHNMCNVFQEDIGAPAFEGSPTGAPADNDGLRNKYVMVGGTESWNNLYLDPTLPTLKNDSLDMVFGAFKGSLFGGQLTYKFDPFPLRIHRTEAGVVSMPAPQIINNTNKKIYVNPLYRDAGWEVAFLVGADAYQSIKVGPPPSEFTGQNMKASKFYSMRWNGEIQITDQILIQRGTVGGGDLTYELNRYGTQLQLIGQATHGILAGDPRYVLPVIYRRQRPTDE